MRLLLKLCSLYKMCVRPHLSSYFWKQRFFSVLAFCPHVNGAAGTINTVFQKRSPEWSFASIILDSPFNCGRTKNGGFRIRWCHTSYSILCRECYRTSIVLAFSSAFCFVSFQVFLINALQFTGFLILLFCMERPLAIMLCLVLLLLIPLCFANDEISNDEVSWSD